MPKIESIRDRFDSPIKLDDYLSNQDKILIIRAVGGIGDVLISRMLFEDLKALKPSIEVCYAVQPIFFPLVQDHPFIDRVLDCNNIKLTEWPFFRDITHKAGTYEAATMPFIDKHRTDVWAEYIGYELKNHEGHMHLDEEDITWGKAFIKPSDKPRIGISPISAHASKDWGIEKFQKLINRIGDKAEIYIFHNSNLDLEGDNCHKLLDLTFRQWIAAVDELDMMVTVMTANFNIANMLHKPTIAIAGAEDLDIYGKYFPELVPIQRHRKDGEEWEHCPCWRASGWCAYDSVKQYPRKCIRSITVDEVYAEVEKLISKLKGGVQLSWNGVGGKV
ncbi:MAG: glycosyltransferase family 9 protein [Pseudomonadota bacterium]|nr:glycosyltransferase family 9 protein [Pseudomonadota bacterium]